jgi:hypothetical protein
MPADLPAGRSANAQFAPTPPLLANGKNSERSFSSTWRKNVQLKYRLYRRRDGVFYWQDNNSKKQGTLRTTERREAERLLHAMNESHRQPTLNLNLARAYLAAHDPKMAQRTWQAVMDEMSTHGIPSTQVRCGPGFRSKSYDLIRNKPLVQTTGEDLLAIVHASGNCVTAVTDFRRPANPMFRTVCRPERRRV